MNFDDELPQRECDGCTACCKGWLTTKVDGYQLSPGTPCKSLGTEGCSVYGMRPQDPCVAFFCGWLINPDMPDWMSPKTSKVIIKPNFVWERPSSAIPVHVANAAAPKIPGRTIAWLKQFTATNKCSFICNEPERIGKTYTGKFKKFGIGTPEFEAEVAKWVAEDHAFYIKPSASNLLIGGKWVMHSPR